MDIQQEVEDVEKELLDLIISHLKEDKIKSIDAQSLAKEFLNTLPITDHADLLNKLKYLGESYPEAGQVYTQELKKTSEEIREQKLEEMRHHIKQGDIEKAISSAKAMNAN